nr:hypothetical protein [Tanacetum cinerariifolium]
LRSLETSFSEYRQTNQFDDVVSAIPGIVHQYMDQQMNSLQRETDEFLCNIDENMKKVLKGLVKNQVKEQVSRILPRIEESVNATLEAEVLTRSSHSSRTSYAIAADLSKMEIKKILIEKMEGNKREDDDQEGPSAGSNRGSKRQKEGGEQASASTPSEKATKGAGLQDSLQRENDEFLRNIDENMKKVLKGLVKNQVKEQVSRILPRIEESVNATLEAKVLTRSSHSSRTSYAIAADLSEMEIKKILIEKMEGNKSIQRFDEQQNLYKALVEAYEVDKAILDTYGDSTILKRRREDDDQEGPSAGPNQGSKRPKEGGEQASASTPSEKVTKGTGGSTTGFQSQQRSASESAYAEEPVQTTYQMEETPLPVYETGADDQPIVQTS